MILLFLIWKQIFLKKKISHEDSEIDYLFDYCKISSYNKKQTSLKTKEFLNNFFVYTNCKELKSKNNETKNNTNKNNTNKNENVPIQYTFSKIKKDIFPWWIFKKRIKNSITNNRKIYD